MIRLYKIYQKIVIKCSGTCRRTVNKLFNVSQGMILVMIILMTISDLLACLRTNTSTFILPNNRFRITTKFSFVNAANFTNFPSKQFP